jgi:AAA+ superfamily predicted ATPase
MKENAEVIKQELAWFREMLHARLQLYLGQESAYTSIWEIQPPAYTGKDSYYARFIEYYQSTAAERLVLMLALAPHVQPPLLDAFFVKNATYDRGFTEFGGHKGNTHSGFLPSAETAMFLLAGDDIYLRAQAIELLSSTHYLVKHNIIQLGDPGYNEPYLSGSLTMSQDYINFFSTGQNSKPSFSKEFPAKLITTQMEWHELVLPDDTITQIEEIKTWIQHQHTLMNDWGFYKKLKPGYKSLFYGPPGTGKTLVACLIGKLCEMDVYRIDLSMLVSKYIGETEKNLEKVFQMAENKKWILFFDEADALFGKRTGVSDSHDRYANQETAYLLQRIEDFSGVVILATNLKSNIDEAFARRFQSLVYFPIPQPEERLRLWEQAFSHATVLEEKLNLKQLARQHELTGGMIMNVIRYCSLMALKRNENIIRLNDAEKGIQKELLKEGRIM